MAAQERLGSGERLAPVACVSRPALASTDVIGGRPEGRGRPSARRPTAMMPMSRARRRALAARRRRLIAGGPGSPLPRYCLGRIGRPGQGVASWERAAEGAMAGTVAHVVGARPNFMKAAPVIRALGALGRATPHPHRTALRRRSPASSSRSSTCPPGHRPRRRLRHPRGPDRGHHGRARRVFGAAAPALVVVYGDVNSTLAAALVCAKRRCPWPTWRPGCAASMRRCPRRSTGGSPTCFGPPVRDQPGSCRQPAP